MDKRILEQYIDACENIKEIEKEIIRLKKKRELFKILLKGAIRSFLTSLRVFTLRELPRR